VRNGGHILNRTDLKAGRLQRPDGRLPAGAWALDKDIDLAHAVLHRASRGSLGGHLRGKGVDLREPLNPTWPDDAQEITLPPGSVMDTIVLLKVLLM